MNQANALRGAAAGLQAVPTPTPEIETEMARLQEAVSRVDNFFADLAQRLHTVRTDLEPVANGTAPKEVGPHTKLGSSLRAMADRLDSVGDQIAYQTRNLQLPN